MIRAAIEADVDQIGRLWQQLATYHMHLHPDLPRPAPNGWEVYARRISTRLADRNMRVLVAEEDDQIVGFVLGVIVDLIPQMFDQETSGFLADIYVDTAYRRRGIGKALVRSLIDWFEARDVRYFEWYVSTYNAEAIAFWQAVGGRDVMRRMRLDVPGK